MEGKGLTGKEAPVSKEAGMRDLEKAQGKEGSAGGLTQETSTAMAWLRKSGAKSISASSGPASVTVVPSCPSVSDRGWAEASSTRLQSPTSGNSTSPCLL